MHNGQGGEEVVPLAYVSEGAVVQVVSIRGGRGLTRRLRDLGIYEGSYIKVIRSSGPGPVIISLLDPSTGSIGRRIALGFGITTKILVKVLGHD